MFWRQLREKWLNLKKWQKIAIIAAIVLLFTNPSPEDCAKDLNAHQHHYGYNYFGGVERKANLLLFSIYNADGSYYIGILKNFIPI